MLHQMKLQPHSFQKVKDGIKTIESRLYDEKRQKIQVGDYIEFALVGDESQTVTTKVIELHRYKNFPELFDAFPVEMFGSKTKEDLNGVYKYYLREDEEKYGVLGIKIKVLTPEELEALHTPAEEK